MLYYRNVDPENNEDWIMACLDAEDFELVRDSNRN